MPGRLLVFLLLLLLPGPAAWSEEVSPRFVLIIDDIGDNLELGKAAVTLPGPLTYAVLPHSPFGKHLAELANEQGKGVMLHAPMANTQNFPLGPGGLYLTQSQDELKDTLRAGLDSVPHARGLNNHMGSLLTQNRRPMTWVMEVIQERNLFFVDSKTTALSVAGRVAREHQVPFLIRDVFLDHEITEAFIHQQFELAIRVAQEKGSVVVIGHPYRETVDYLRSNLSRLDELGIQQLTVSAMLHQEQVFERIIELEGLAGVRCRSASESECGPVAKVLLKDKKD
ncbi:divergent polysaccharide deacetylase family protein [Nitrincola alkalilacustris]|uniref:divergent polysaccharide deacetylase family protein n=1 Tax=Nitrincola alkalilacustris TaxID=1571224 RepID=UPI00124BE218|nr:divergent polysaccharide deacetylase family protein [Nitrincola alkalilacustris]